MTKTLVLLFTISLFISCKQKSTTSIQVENKKSIKDSLNLKLENLNSKKFFNGFGVSIVDSTGVLYKKGIGFADVSSNKAYTTQTIQPIASVSKTFIGIALMKAQEKGLLKLDDPINKYLSFDVINPNFTNEDITIRQLSTHTSTIIDSQNYMGRAYILKDDIDKSLPENENIPQSFNARDTNISLAQFLENYLSETGTWYEKTAFNQNKPGDVFEYSNVGAALAAYIIEVVSNQSYSDFTRDHILNPLEMNDSGWNYNEINFDEFTTLYSDSKTIVPHYSLITYPDGGFLTTINDLSKYLNEIIRGYTGSGQLLSQDSYNELFKMQLEAKHFTDRNPNHPYDDEYNTGIFMGMSALKNIGHTGGDPGVTSIMFFNTENKIGRILLINTNINNQEQVNIYYDIFNALGEFSEEL
jgi:CubicO group peptidase (beta-lactamase class C family)